MKKIFIVMLLISTSLFAEVKPTKKQYKKIKSNKKIEIKGEVAKPNAELNLSRKRTTKVNLNLNVLYTLKKSNKMLY